MFNNLIESRSHRTEFKRRGSFLVFTTGTYAFLFALAGVASVYAYDARLREQNLEVSILRFQPVALLPETVRQPNRAERQGTSRSNSTGVRPVRTILNDQVDNPVNAPDPVGVAPAIPAAPRGAVAGPDNANPPGDPFRGRGGSGSGDEGSRVSVNAGEIPAPPTPKRTAAPKETLRTTRVLNGEALSLPEPPYPPLARQAGVQGTVNVQIVIDENGRVISARAVSGNPLLTLQAERAALRARFSPTMLGDQAVRVSGLITYNFVLH